MSRLLSPASSRARSAASVCSCMVLEPSSLPTGVSPTPTICAFFTMPPLAIPESLVRFLDQSQLFCDDVALDFRRPFADGVHEGVPQNPPHRVFPHHAVTAVDLDRFSRGPHGHL